MILKIILIIPSFLIIKKNVCIDVGSRNRHLSNEECIFSISKGAGR